MSNSTDDALVKLALKDCLCVKDVYKIRFLVMCCDFSVTSFVENWLEKTFLREYQEIPRETASKPAKHI